MVIEQVETPDAVADLYPLFKQLRPHLDFKEYMELVQAAKIRDQYQVIAAKEERELEAFGAMGMRVLYDLVHGKHLYIDDLVVHQSYRSQGIGAELLKYAEEKARELGCLTIRLSTGMENELGKRFYQREGWDIRALTFKKKMQ